MEKQKDKKKSWVLVTLLIVILLIAAVGGGFLVGANYVSSKTLAKKSEVKEENENVEETGLDISVKASDKLVKERLEKFVLAGLDYNYANGGTYRHFANGTKSLSDEVKLKMTYFVTKTGNSQYTLTEEEINKLTGVKPSVDEPVMAMSKIEFDNNYKELFNEDAPEFNSEKMQFCGCPAPMAFNPETKTMYLLSRCGGTGTDKITSTIKSFDSDEKYIYVHTESRWEDLSVSEEPPKTTKLVWAFDKDLKFVRTKVEK